MRNYPEFLLAFLGVTAVGGVAVPLNSLWVADELEYGVKNANCKVLPHVQMFVSGGHGGGGVTF
jgi:long-chain acyl-CoA synthetase